MDYKTQDAEPTTLYKLVRSEPDWAASSILEGEKAQQEIESLRSTVDQLTRTLAACCIARDLTADDRDEWKRRAVMMWEFIGGEYFYVPSVPAGVLDIRKTFLKTYPEAAIWLEEE